MTLRSRRILIIGVIAVLILLANAWAIAGWLDDLGLIKCAQEIQRHFLTGTAIAVIVAMLISLKPITVSIMGGRVANRSCPVCDEPLVRCGPYCPECGSRV